MTKLTGNHDSIARNEKNDAVIKSTPIQSQPTRSARKMKAAIARGRKSCTSPSSFIACVRQISPPVPVTTTKIRMEAVRMSGRRSRDGPRLGRARRRAVDQENAEEDQKDASPARGRNLFVQE